MAFAAPHTDAGDMAVFCQLPQVARGDSEGEGRLAGPEGQRGGIVELRHELLLVFAFGTVVKRQRAARRIGVPQEAVFPSPGSNRNGSKSERVASKLTVTGTVNAMGQCRKRPQRTPRDRCRLHRGFALTCKICHGS